MASGLWFASPWIRIITQQYSIGLTAILASEDFWNNSSAEKSPKHVKLLKRIRQPLLPPTLRDDAVLNRELQSSNHLGGLYFFRYIF